MIEAVGEAAPDSAPTLELIASGRNDTRLSPSSIAIMRRHARHLGDEAFKAMLDRFERDLALDTVRNDHDLRIRLGKLVIANNGLAVHRLNEMVYARIFLTPSSDPWLGLLPPDGYAALSGEGIVEGPSGR